MITQIKTLGVLLFLIFGIISNITAQEKKELFSLTLEELMNIKVITASKFVEDIKDIPASVVIVEREEIERLGYTTVQEILQSIPGLFMIDDYYWLGSVNFGVRGFFSTGPFNDMIILVNGVNQMSDKYSDYPDVKINVPVESIERIEVIRGPMSVIYGSGAFFGAINIITNKSSTGTPTSLVSVSYGNYGRKKLNFKYSGEKKELKYSINVAFDKTDGIDNPFSDITTKMGILDYVGIEKNSTISGQRDDSRKYFQIALDFENFFTDFSYAETQKDVFDGLPNYYGGSQMITNAVNFVLGYEKQFSRLFTGLARFGYYSHNHTLNYNVFRPNYYEIDAQQTHSYDFEINGIFNISEKLEILFGLYRRSVQDILQISDFGYYSLNAGQGEIGLPSDETYSNHAVFTQIKYSPFSKIKFVGGVRLELIDEYNMEYARGIITENPDDNRPPDSLGLRRIYKGTFTPENNGVLITSRLAAIYSFTNCQVLKLMFGQATKQSSFTENYKQLPEGNPQLNAASIRTFEINYIANYSDFLNVNASIFFNSIDNLISSTNIYHHTHREWHIYSSNSGKQETTGFELGLKIRPIKYLIMNISGVYQKSKNLKEGYKNITLGYSPELLGYFDISYLFNKDISIALLGRYIGEVETLWKTDDTPENGSRIGNKIDGYFIFDMNFRCNNILGTNIFTALKIGNILDIEVRYPTTTCNVWADKGTLGFGREILFSVGYKF